MEKEEKEWKMRRGGAEENGGREERHKKINKLQCRLSKCIIQDTIAP
jgi:hypothetical protein